MRGRAGAAAQARPGGGGLVSGGVVAIVQARMGSSRLPGKVLLRLGEVTVLECLLERVARARLVGTLVVATTTAREDDPIATLCVLGDVRCYRGHATDLLDRHLRAARACGAEHVVKIPSDCALIDPAVIDRVLGAYLDRAGRYDYVSNLHPPTYPDGNDVEVFSFAALESAWRLARRPLDREHTTPFLWDTPGAYRLGNVAWETGRDLSMTHRVVLDYAE
ncbi:MAG TPA: acylneuraminate cytidylyltransferase, partial [Deltaproteobacteria bacterium]|nr:acylneuraminate cytidylyltransferase [Deltaproteobacteria bacterium]